MTAHAEPWLIIGGAIQDFEGNVIMDSGEEEAPELLRRIVACVNVNVGIPTEVLEAMGPECQRLAEERGWPEGFPTRWVNEPSSSRLFYVGVAMEASMVRGLHRQEPAS